MTQTSNTWAKRVTDTTPVVTQKEIDYALKTMGDFTNRALLELDKIPDPIKSQLSQIMPVVAEHMNRGIIDMLKAIEPAIDYANNTPGVPHPRYSMLHDLALKKAEKLEKSILVLPYDDAGPKGKTLGEFLNNPDALNAVREAFLRCTAGVEYELKNKFTMYSLSESPSPLRH